MKKHLENLYEYGCFLDIHYEKDDSLVNYATYWMDKVKKTLEIYGSCLFTEEIKTLKSLTTAVNDCISYYKNLKTLPYIIKNNLRYNLYYLEKLEDEMLVTENRKS